MFDFHIHSRVSFDGHDTGRALAQAALDAGLKEICFTDHLDYDPTGQMGDLTFRTEVYNAEYDRLSLPGLTIRRGVEFGLTRIIRRSSGKTLPGVPLTLSSAPSILWTGLTCILSRSGRGRPFTRWSSGIWRKRWPVFRFMRISTYWHI